MILQMKRLPNQPNFVLTSPQNEKGFEVLHFTKEAGAVVGIPKKNSLPCSYTTIVI